MSKADFYKTLGVARTASDDEIKAAYRALARKLHPDVNDAPDAAARFAEVQEAYDVLSDPDKRRLYDRAGHAGFEAPPAGGAWAESAPPDLDDFGSMFDTFFGARDVGAGFGGFGSTHGARTRSAPRAAPQRPPDLTHESTIDLETAARGGSQRIVIKRGDQSRTIDVTIPKGVGDGARLRVRGEGQPARAPGATPSDLILTIRVRPHPRFTRGAGASSLDLSTDLPLTISEATLGAKVSLTLLLGSEVTITIPPATPSAARLRVKGAGLEDASGKKGDLYAQVKIIPPDPSLVDDQLRNALEALSARQGNIREADRPS